MIGGHVQIFLRDIISPFICQMKMNLFSPEVQAGPESLLRLRPFIRDMICFSVYFKISPCLDKVKSNIMKPALVA